jgi:hypothetical protein
MDSGARAYAGEGAVRPQVSDSGADYDDAGTEPGDQVWTLIALPDTQYYAESAPEIFDSQVDWILRTADELDTRFVVHLGDIVDNNVEVEWERAASSMKKLSGRIPFALAVGNHDLGAGGTSNVRSSLIDDYFEWNDLGAPENLGGRYDHTLWNAYHFFRGVDTRWLVLSLEFGPRDDVLRWADEVVSSHPEHDVIVVTHAYLYSDDRRYDWENFGAEQGYNPYSYGLEPPPETPEEARSVNDGQQMWDKLVSRHANIRFVLCGHVHPDGFGFLASEGINGNTVFQILSNYQRDVIYQGQYLDRSGYLRIMQFDEGRKRVNVYTYSPWLDRYLTDRDNAFWLRL